ncbi:MAG: serine/threonine-protein kinase [Myxococcota bacterium]
MSTGALKLSRAAQHSLDRAIAEQRDRNARPVLNLRLGLTAVGSLLFLLLQNDDPAIRLSRQGTYVYFALALLLVGLVRVAPRLLRYTVFAVAVLDVPLLSFLHYAQLAQLPQPLMNTPVNAAMMIGLVILSASALSRVAIGVTALAAFVSVASVGRAAGLDPLPLGLTLLVIPGVAFACGFLVSRMRDVVRQSRMRDLLGKYTLGERLGVGGMAEVFLATYCPEGGFERRVAIKRMLPSLAAHPESVALFRREAEVGSALAHPNLVNVLDFGSTETGGLFLVMEYVDGCTLSELLRRARQVVRPLPPAAMASLAWGLAEALDHLHEHLSPSGVPQHFVHRDVNPPNVLLSRGGDVKLSDFGIARDVDAGRLTQDGLMRGKLAYAAPEQLLGLAPDGRLDLFALGVTLYECLTLERPFRAQDAVALQQEIISGVVPEPKVVGVAESLWPVIRGLLVSDRERRTASARALLVQLSALDGAAFDLREGRRQLAAMVTETMAVRATPQGATPIQALPPPGGATATVELPRER